jgi:hypothetical protein
MFRCCTEKLAEHFFFPTEAFTVKKYALTACKMDLSQVNDIHSCGYIIQFPEAFKTQSEACPTKICSQTQVLTLTKWIRA